MMGKARRKALGESVGDRAGSVTVSREGGQLRSGKRSGTWQKKGVPHAAQTHILRRLPQNVTHAPSVPQAVVQDSDDAHEQRVAGALPLVSLCF